MASDRMAELGMSLSLPFNWEADYEDVVLSAVGDRVEEVYVPLHWTVAATGRPWNGPQGRREYLARVDRLQAALGPGHLNFVANQRLGPLDKARVVDEVLDLAERYPSATFSVRSLETAERIKAGRPSVEVGPSTFSGIDSVMAARYWLHFVQPSVLTVSRDINRRPDLLKRIRRLGARLKVVARDHCIPECPWEDEHLAAIVARDAAAAASPIPIPAAMAGCRREAMFLKGNPQFAYLPALITLLPGHLPHLKGIVDVVKLEGRLLGSALIRDEARSFLAAESLTSTTSHPYTEPADAWEHIANCDRDCTVCHWCRDHVRMHGAGAPGVEAPLDEPLAGPERTVVPEKAAAPEVLGLVLAGAAGEVQLRIQEAGGDGKPFRRTARFGISYRGQLGDGQIRMVTAFADAVRAAEEREDLGLQSLAAAEGLRAALGRAGLSLREGRGDQI